MQSVTEPNGLATWISSYNDKPGIYSSIKKHHELFFNVFTYLTKKGLSIILEAYFSFNIFGITFPSDAVDK